MKRTATISLTLLPVLLFGVLWSTINHRRSSADFILASYPRDPAFDAVIKRHKDWVNSTDGSGVFYATWFIEGEPYQARECDVNENGSVFVGFVSPDCARGVTLQIPNTQVKLLKTALREPPPNVQAPSLQNLLIVSCKTGGQRMTCIYDRQDLPSEIKAAYKFIGEELEVMR